MSRIFASFALGRVAQLGGVGTPVAGKLTKTTKTA